MDLGNGWTTEKLRDEILEHIWIDETGDMGGVHCMHCLGYEQGEIDRAINTVFAAALQRAKAEGERFGLQQGLLIAHIIETGTAAQVIDGINARIAELDARAAQIEALEQEGT